MPDKEVGYITLDSKHFCFKPNEFVGRKLPDLFDDLYA
jgi:hypothetical protein